MIGVLALQGNFASHRAHLDRLGVKSLCVRNKEDLSKVQALIIPGGESTSLLKLLKRGSFFEDLQDYAKSHPVFGTCAGLIMMAQKLHPTQDSLGLLSVEVKRNAYGRQLESHTVQTSEVSSELGVQALTLVLIRAPVMTKLDPKVKVLASCRQQAMLVRQGHLLAASFHPELTYDLSVHKYFIKMVEQYAA